MREPLIRIAPQEPDKPGRHYEHWSGHAPRIGGHSDIAWYVSTPHDFVTGFCSCGEWAGRASIYAHSVDEMQQLITAEWEKHKDAAAALSNPDQQ